MMMMMMTIVVAVVVVAMLELPFWSRGCRDVRESPSIPEEIPSPGSSSSDSGPQCTTGG